MSDQRLRELERAFAASGDPEDEARYLLARVRAGELSDDALAMASWLGHDAARRALGDAARVADPGISIDRLVEGLLDWSGEAQVRAYVTVAGLCVREIQKRQAQPDARVRRALEAAQAWVACPCDLHAGVAHERSAALRQPLAPVLDSGPREPGEAAMLLTWRAAYAASSGRIDRNRDLYEAGRKFGNVGAARAKQAVREALLPWLLA